MQSVKELYNLIIQSNPQNIEEDDCIEVDTYNKRLSQIEPFFKTEQIHDNKTRIFKNQGNLFIYWNIDDFKARANKDSIKKDILIIFDETKQSLFFQASSKTTYQQFVASSKDFLLENAYYYFRTLDILKEQEHKEDHLFYFVDYFNSSLRKIIFTSLNKEGKLTIGFPIGIPELSRIKSLKESCLRFFNSFAKENKHLPKFIKNELFKSLIKEKPEERIVKLFENLDDIMLTAEQNFELYLSDLSLDKFRTEYIEYKEKYFFQIRDILGKITTQVVALPLSITAAAFATYRTTDKPILFFLVASAFLIFSIYSFFLIRLYKFDVLDIQKSFEKDFSDLSKEDYFLKYPKELNSFRRVEFSIKSRVTNLIKLIFAYTFLLALTNSMFILFALLQKGIDNSTAFIVSFISFLVLGGILYFVVWNIEKEEQKNEL